MQCRTLLKVGIGVDSKLLSATLLANFNISLDEVSLFQQTEGIDNN